MTTRPETTAVLATLLRLADKAGAPGDFTARLWHIKGCEHDEQLRQLAEVHDELASVCMPTQATTEEQVAAVVPLFGAP